MASLPPENRQFIRIDAGTFYTASTASQQVSAAELAGQLRAVCLAALRIGETLRLAADAGVERAGAVVAVLDTVAAFSDAEAAGAFLAALDAAAGDG